MLIEFVHIVFDLSHELEIINLLSSIPMAKQNFKKSGTVIVFFCSNYKLLGIAVLLIVGGFAAMYMENEINGFISLYVSPIVVMVVMLSWFAIPKA